MGINSTSLFLPSTFLYIEFHQKEISKYNTIKQSLKHHSLKTKPSCIIKQDNMEHMDRFQSKLTNYYVFHPLLALLKRGGWHTQPGPLVNNITAFRALGRLANYSSRTGRNLNSDQTYPQHLRQFNALEKSKLYICSFTKKKVCSSVHIRHLYPVTNTTLRGCIESNSIHAFLII